MDRIDQIRQQYQDLRQDSQNNLVAYKAQMITLEQLGLNEIEYRQRRQALELEARLLGYDLQQEIQQAASNHN